MKHKIIAVVQLVLFYGFFLYLGAPEVRTAPNLYILLVIGSIALLYQPSFSSFGGGTARDRGTARLILSSIQITQALALAEAIFWRYPVSFHWDAVAWIGLVASLFGLGLRSWAIRHLGKAFTWHIDPDAAETLITDGPYRVFRHPSYIGAFFLYAGAILFLHAYYSLLISLVLMPLAFWRRMKFEEAALQERFGEDYTTYCNRVGRVRPNFS